MKRASSVEQVHDQLLPHWTESLAGHDHGMDGRGGSGVLDVACLDSRESRQDCLNLKLDGLCNLFFIIPLKPDNFSQWTCMELITSASFSTVGLFPDNEQLMAHKCTSKQWTYHVMELHLHLRPALNCLNDPKHLFKKSERVNCVTLRNMHKYMCRKSTWCHWGCCFKWPLDLRYTSLSMSALYIYTTDNMMII